MSKSRKINIPRTVEDDCYRYKMSPMKVELQGKNQSTITNFINLAEVAADLQTEPKYILKFFSLHFSTREAGKGEVYGLRGSYAAGQLNVALDQFILQLILCPKCNLPETNMAPGHSVLVSSCRACGHSRKLDNSSKIVNYIHNQLLQGAPKKPKKNKADEDLDFFKDSMKGNPLTQNLF